MKPILTCTDGSVYSVSVYDHAAWAAKRLETSIHVLHMLDPHRERADLADFSGNLGLDTSTELMEDLVSLEETKNRVARERGKIVLEAARKHLIAQGVSGVTIEQLHGELVESVTSLEARAELVVIGKRGESANFATMHLGSNLERVIRASIRPVLVAARQFTPISDFLLAYDGGPSAQKAVAFLLQSVLLAGLKCHLLRAGKIDDQAEWDLQETAKKLRAAGYDVEPRALPGDPEDIISEVIATEQVGLLVMGAYGHSRIRQLIVGSTTTEMVRSCLVPVLMFR